MTFFQRFLFKALLILHPSEERKDYQDEFREVLAERFRHAGNSAVQALGISIREAVAIVRHRVGVYRFHGSSTRNVGGNVLNSILQDLRGGLRGLRRNPGLGAVVVVTLAVAIGAGTSIFSVVNGVLLKPLPVPDQDRLLAVWGRFLPESGFDFEYFPLSPPEYFDYAGENNTLSHVVAYSTGSATVTGLSEEPVRVPVAVTGSDMFSALGVRPALGNAWTPDEDVSDGRTIVISYAMWSTFFGKDPAVIGRSITLDGDPHEVVGVMPRSFGFPTRDVMIWAPYGLTPESGGRASHSVRAFARMQDGVSIADVRAELDVLMGNWKEEFPDIHTGHFLIVEPLIDNYVRNVRTAMFVVLGAVGLLLLIACVNIAGVLLARGETRLGEFAVRHALGAGKSRLFQQLLVEYSVLALVGGGLGVGLAYLGVPLLMGIEGNGIPRIDEVAVDPMVLMFSLATTLAALCLFGVIPALQAARANTSDLIKQGARQSATAGQLFFRRALISGEVALAVVIASAAGLMLNSVRQLGGVDTGINASGRLVADISLPSSSYGETGQSLNFYATLLARLGAEPRIVSATAANQIPYVRTPGVWDFQISGRAEDNVNGIRLNGHIDFVHDDFFETMGMRLIRGRLFNEQDVAGSEMVTVISEAMAETFWPDADPIGQGVSIGGSDDMGTVVGIVSDVHWQGMREAALPTRYYRQVQAASFVPFMTRRLQVAIQTSVDPMDLVPTLRSIVRDIDPNLPLENIQTIDAAVGSWLAQDRFFSLLMGLFAFISLALGTVGIYGVMSYTVAKRGKEIGIRMALGAPSNRVASSMLGQALVLTVIGVTLGVAATLAGGSVLQSLLYGVAPRDPATLTTVALLFGLIGVVASLVPAIRAARINPVEALRAE